MSATVEILYVVPENEEVRKLLTERVEYFSASVSGPDDSPGEVAQISLEDCDDPIDDLNVFSSLMEEHKVKFFATTDSFTERSRGMRAEGTLTYFDGVKKETNSFPWVEGEPEFNTLSMRKAGFSEDTVEEVDDQFFWTRVIRPRL